LQLLSAGHDHATAGAELGVPAGQAFLIATGRPADGTDTAAQALGGVPAFNPLTKAHVMPWVRERARRELKGGR
jgi:hypothetical protein